MVTRSLRACAAALALLPALPGQSAVGHWAFRKMRSVQVPTVAASEWPRGDVDRFILSRLRQSELAPRSATDPYRLVRRLHFDLTGLPPSVETIRAFVADPSDAAFDRLVDRLLGSRRYAERWARHWLDVVRFAESSGGGRSLMLPHAWRYRDYVVDAFHADRPFDQFVREQLAGDLLPFASDEQRNRQLIATGFLELGPTNYELQDKELLRMEVIDEQIDTMGRALLGMTLGCARCHDHKFDPVPTADYYALAGIFGSTQVLTPSNVSGYVQRDLLGPESDRYRAFAAKRDALQKQLAQARKALGKAPSRRERRDLEGVVIDDSQASFVGNWKHSTSVPGFLEDGYRHDENTAKGEKSVRFDAKLTAKGAYEVRLFYTAGTNRASNVPVEIVHATGTERVIVNQRRAAATSHGGLVLGQFEFARSGGSVTVRTLQTDGHVIVDGVQLVRAERKNAKSRRPAKRRGRRTSARVRQLTAELAKLRKTAPKQAPKAMAVRDVAEPADGYIHVRGLVRKKGARQPRGFLTACGNARPEIPVGESGRRQLADWIVSADHPLTARVYVNRVWQHLFGKGLVATPDNFGVMGEKPSHPELLDWLAKRFIAEGWSTKKLIRKLVRSSAYRLASAVPDGSSEVDPENRLLAFANRRRLDAESIRDAILTASGQLDTKVGGPTIRKVKTYDYDYAFESRRRSIYVPRFRGTRLPLFEVFDAADPNLVVGKRVTSNVPTQALYLMNSPWMMAQADHVGARLMRIDPAVRLEHAYLAIVGRLPSARERALATRFLDGFAAGDMATAWSRLAHTLFACLDFRYLD